MIDTSNKVLKLQGATYTGAGQARGRAGTRAWRGKCLDTDPMEVLGDPPITESQCSHPASSGFGSEWFGAYKWGMWSCKSLPGKASLWNNASIVHREGLFLENDLQSLQCVLDAIIPLNMAKLNLLKVDWMFGHRQKPFVVKSRDRYRVDKSWNAIWGSK